MGRDVFIVALMGEEGKRVADWAAMYDVRRLVAIVGSSIRKDEVELTPDIILQSFSLCTVFNIYIYIVIIRNILTN